MFIIPLFDGNNNWKLANTNARRFVFTQGTSKTMSMLRQFDVFLTYDEIYLNMYYVH